MLALDEAPALQWTAPSEVQRRTEFEKEEHLQGTVEVSGKQDDLQRKGTVAPGAILGLEVLPHSRQAGPRNDLGWP